MVYSIQEEWIWNAKHSYKCNHQSTVDYSNSCHYNQTIFSRGLLPVDCPPQRAQLWTHTHTTACALTTSQQLPVLPHKRPLNDCIHSCCCMWQHHQHCGTTPNKPFLIELAC
uniref:Uncharacterized protein n=1 Tax=Ditylenchus dipsaci TaxID=166011 RepID=A0A915EVH5_9BILA